MSRATTAAALAVTALALAACGASTPALGPPPWAAAHPDPQGMHFLAPEGLCSVTVRYPDEAPGEIELAGATYVQRERTSGTPSDRGQLVAESGDWRIYQTSSDTLLLLTPAQAYRYKSGANCGSNSAPPSG